MKEARLTLKNIDRAIAFLERRVNHAKKTGNKEWQRNFENAISVIKGLSAYGS